MKLELQWDHLPVKPGTRFKTCASCHKTFNATHRRRATRCQPCAREAANESKRKSRAKLGKTRPPKTPGNGPRSKPKEFPLSCGHSIWLRQAPMDGEFNYCHRCVDWTEYIHYKPSGVMSNNKFCKNGHRLSPAMSYTIGRSTKKCRRCNGEVP